MNQETEKRIVACYKELARISNYHRVELSSYQAMKLSSAYYDLVDMFDKQRETEWNDAMRPDLPTPKAIIE